MLEKYGRPIIENKNLPDIVVSPWLKTPIWTKKSTKNLNFRNAKEKLEEEGLKSAESIKGAKLIHHIGSFIINNILFKDQT